MHYVEHISEETLQAAKKEAKKQRGEEKNIDVISIHQTYCDEKCIRTAIISGSIICVHFRAETNLFDFKTAHWNVGFFAVSYIPRLAVTDRLHFNGLRRLLNFSLEPLCADICMYRL